MSGRGKTTLYQIFDWFLWLAAIAGVVLLILFTVPKARIEWQEILAAIGLVLCLVLRIPALVHELGHLLFGTLAGMKPAAVTVSLFRVSAKGIKFIGYSQSAAGSTEMYPRSAGNMRARMFIYTLGGGVMNLLVGGLFLTLYLMLLYSAGLFFLGMLSLYMLYEGIRAFVPAELPAGKTDGAVLCGLIKKAPDEEVACRVLEIQGSINQGTFADIPRERMFDVPVVREDLPAWRALLFLRMQYLLACGDEEGAGKTLQRLKTLAEYMSEDELSELARLEGRK